MRTTLDQLLLWILACAISIATSFALADGAAEADPSSYTMTKRAVLYNDASVYMIEKGKVDERFMGPILFNGKVVIVQSIHNQILVFGGKGKLSKKIKVPARTPLMFYPDRPSIGVAVNLGNSILLYNTDGKAYLFTGSLRLKRIPNLTFDPDKCGNPHLDSFQPYTNSVLRIPCSLREKHDHEVVINLKTMKIEYQGKRQQ